MPYHLATPQREAVFTTTRAAVQEVNWKKYRNYLWNFCNKDWGRLELIPLSVDPARMYRHAARTCAESGAHIGKHSRIIELAVFCRRFIYSAGTAEGRAIPKC